MQVNEAVLPGHAKADDLSFGVNAGIGATGANHSHILLTEALQRLLQLTLHRSALCLNLKSEQICAVVFDDGPERGKWGCVSIKG